ncbi:hypothetical protein TeGR_g3165 [Tetraparma gracilis]|uniref:Protein YIPF n=1 Tax=Tetraparma gracilis TaxID=2962635 RepID=A0ABQ6MNX2_9STRA|nr:hypothetical protein TeGR_g3165 [Tetraparma gracilis]
MSSFSSVPVAEPADSLLLDTDDGSTDDWHKGVSSGNTFADAPDDPSWAQATAAAAPAPAAPASSLCWCFDVGSYKPYFDINTSEVAERLKESLKVWEENGHFVNQVLAKGAGPDAYGPFWLSMSLVFVVSVTSNINAWFGADKADFETDINALVHSLWIVYAFSFGMPIVSYFAMNCLGRRQVGVSFMQLFSLYGYSLSLFLPACLLCAIPNAAVQWTALLVATAFSAALILRNLITPIMEADAKSARALLGWFAGCQLILFLTLKVVFYK